MAASGTWLIDDDDTESLLLLQLLLPILIRFDAADDGTRDAILLFL